MHFIIPPGLHGSDFTIKNSVLFDGTTGYLSRTPSIPGNLQAWTLSCWVKDSGASGTECIFSASTGLDVMQLTYEPTTHEFRMLQKTAGSDITNAKYRDPSAWRHLVVSWDGADMLWWVNGTQVTDFSLTSTFTGDSSINAAVVHAIGRKTDTTNHYLAAYLAEFHFIDGQVLAASSFGRFDRKTGIWAPKRYNGSYGANGFHLDFSNAANLGEDQSGNANNWVVSGAVIQVSDSPVDDPANTVGNYATLNPALPLMTDVTFSNGNKTTYHANGGSRYRTPMSTISMSSGKWYAEFTSDSSTGDSVSGFGVAKPEGIGANIGGLFAGEGIFWFDATDNSRRRDEGTVTNFWGSSWTTGGGDVIGVALDADTGDVWFSLNGVWQESGDPANGTNPAGTLDYETYAFGSQVIVGGVGGNVTNTARFDEAEWSYSAPSGFQALHTANIPDSTTITGEHAAVALYQGDGTFIGSGGNAITGVGFQPDFVWIKNRLTTNGHQIYDSLRGGTKLLRSHQNVAELTGPEGLNSFDADGFSLGNDAGVNGSGDSYWALCLKGGGAGVANSDGSITSTVSANTVSGFSIVTGTQGGSSFTFGHGLGVTPEMILYKTTNIVGDWYVWHKGLSSNAHYLQLNNTNSETGASGVYFSTLGHTESIVRMGTGLSSTTDDFVAYCFAGIDVLDTSIFKLGSYAGNGSADGPFSYMDGTPLLFLSKSYSGGTSWWQMFDSVRDPDNVVTRNIQPHQSNAETTTAHEVDFLSNGLKHRDSNLNASGYNYAYLAILSDYVANNNRAR